MLHRRETLARPAARLLEIHQGLLREMRKVVRLKADSGEGIAWDVTGMSARISCVCLALFLALTVSACAARSAPPATAPTGAILEVRQGLASYYGPGFEGKRTASGIPFDKTSMVAAHPTYPFGTIIRVTNLANKRQVEVRVVDRGPARGPRAKGVVIDLSSGAASRLDFIREGHTRVRLEVLRWGD